MYVVSGSNNKPQFGQTGRTGGMLSQVDAQALLTWDNLTVGVRVCMCVGCVCVAQLASCGVPKHTHIHTHTVSTHTHTHSLTHTHTHTHSLTHRSPVAIATWT